MNSTSELLADLDTLRNRTREDRHGYAFSLLLFGVLILATPLLYTPVEDPAPDSPFDPRIASGNLLVQVFRTTAGPDPAHPTLVALYWLFVLVAGFGATAWWYRRRAARVGVETDTRAFLVTAAVAFAGFILGTYVFSRYTLSLYGAWQVNLSLLFGSLALAALVLWRTRHVFGVFVASVCGAVTFSAIAVYTNKGFSALLVIAGGLLTLALLERSRLLTVVSVLFTLAAIPSTAMIVTSMVILDPGIVFYLLGWELDGSTARNYALLHLLLPATVLLAGGTVAAVRYRR
ncbi:MAG: hypothetical protein WBA97_34760 [Actinophytocola sp.]|uniref:hypothetical protein n=1 Tax=Actinophytocola sp. TaxID=1872138 RepID=UPI003C72CD3D